jgi:hypothetical protein
MSMSASTQPKKELELHPEVSIKKSKTSLQANTNLVSDSENDLKKAQMDSFNEDEGSSEDKKQKR